MKRSITRRVWCEAALSSLFLLVSCSNNEDAAAPRLEAVRENTTLGAGDSFRMQIVGEPDLPTEFQVAADGTVTFPYIHILKVAGLEPHELSQMVRDELIEKDILTDPSVIVTVTEYRSKSVTILGQVQRPGTFALLPGMTLLQGISLAGGFTSVAKTRSVILSRTTNGKAETVVIDVKSIYQGSSEDILLQNEDRIYVEERIF